MKEANKVFILKFTIDEVLIFRMAFLDENKANIAKNNLQSIFSNTDKHLLEIEPIIETNLYDKNSSIFITQTYLDILSCCPDWEKGEK